MLGVPKPPSPSLDVSADIPRLPNNAKVASQRAAGDKLESVAIDGVPVGVGGEAKGAVVG